MAMTRVNAPKSVPSLFCVGSTNTVPMHKQNGFEVWRRKRIKWSLRDGAEQAEALRLLAAVRAI